MTRRAAAVLAALVTAGAAGLLADDWRPVRDDPRPNVVIVLTDDQTADSLEAMPYLSSRREDSADHWVDLRNAIVSTPMCCPSRASLLTGRYAHNTGVVTNLDGGLLDEASTLAVWLDDAGYETALVGKYLNGYPFGRGPYVPPGWDRWVAKMQGGPDSVYYRYTLAEQDLPVAHGSAPGDYLTDVLADRAATFVQEALPDRPFFLLFAPTAPHYPWTPAPRHLEAVQSFSAKAPGSLNEADVSDKPEWVRSLPPLSDPQLRRLERQRGRERAALLAVDESIRRIVDALRERGELDETVIFFLTDNGVAFGEHRWILKACPYAACTQTPFLVRLPGVASREELAVVSLVDVAPTIADLAGVVPSPPADGDSLLALLEDSDERSRDAAFMEWVGGNGVPQWRAVRTTGFLYVEYGTGERELYDLSADPFELENRAGDPAFAHVARRLSLLLGHLGDR